MTDYAYRLLNVFTLDRNRLSGNPLCVFEDGRGLDSMTMQALARQFNLSETTFIFPSEKASAAVRIFTPNYEMPFAGPNARDCTCGADGQGRRRCGDIGDEGRRDPGDGRGRPLDA